MTFSMTTNVEYTVEHRSQTFYETHIAHRPALIHFTCSSSLQSELWSTYTNTTTGLSRFKNVIFRRLDVIQENSSLIDTDQFNLWGDLHFTHQNLMVMSSGDSRMKKVGGPLRGQGKSRGGYINVYLAMRFFIVLKIKLLWFTLSNPI